MMPLTYRLQKTTQRQQRERTDSMLMSLLKSQTVRNWLLRRLATAAGATLVTSGLLNQSQVADASGALLVLASVAHSLWEKRDQIKQEIADLTK